MSRKRSIPDDLPTLTDVVGETTGGFPTLTEVVEEQNRDAPIPDIPSPAPSAPELHDPAPQLLQDIQAHIEDVFAQKLQQHLAAAQQQAIEQALAELRAELPQLIRAAPDSGGNISTPPEEQ